MSPPPDALVPAESKASRDNLQDALKGLELGNLPLNKELLSQPKTLDLSKPKSLTPQQLEELKRRLKTESNSPKSCCSPPSQATSQAKPWH